MRQAAPGKRLIEAPTAGNSATCKSCAELPVDGDERRCRACWTAWKHGRGEIEVPEPTRSQAAGCIERMLDFVANGNRPAAPTGALVPGIGAA
jgi:quinolinate synthase